MLISNLNGARAKARGDDFLLLSNIGWIIIIAMSRVDRKRQENVQINLLPDSPTHRYMNR